MGTETRDIITEFEIVQRNRRDGTVMTLATRRTERDAVEALRQYKRECGAQWEIIIIPRARLVFVPRAKARRQRED